MDVDVVAETLSVQVFEQFVRVLRRLDSTGDLSLSAAATLARLTEGGPRRLTELAAAERLSQPGMTQLVTRLERDGLVRRLPCADDGRVVLVEVTEEGRASVRRRRELRARALGRALDAMPPTDRTAIRHALPALGRLVTTAMTG